MFTVIPDAVGKQVVRSLGPGASAREAAQMMTEFDISAVVVLEGEQLIGLVTERDLARRVVGGGLPADTTVLGEVMTARPQTIGADDSTLEALEKMRLGKFRHLPIVDGERVIGMVSMRDLRHSIAREMKQVPGRGVLGRWWGRVFAGP